MPGNPRPSGNPKGNPASLGPPFQKGKSGNPGGSPKGYADFRKKCREYSDDTLAVLVDCAINERKPWAIDTLLAYAWGKPSQAVTGEGGEGDAQITLKVECNGIEFQRRFGTAPAVNFSPSTTAPQDSASA